MSAESLGASTGDRPLPIGLIARVTFTPGRGWDPRPRSRRWSDDADRPRARDRQPASAMAIAPRGRGRRGDRGDAREAEDAAEALLELAAQLPARGSSGAPGPAPVAHRPGGGSEHPEREALTVGEEQAEAPAGDPVSTPWRM